MEFLMNIQVMIVGVLIIVNYGDIMTADLLLIEGNGIKMDESAYLVNKMKWKKNLIINVLNYKIKDSKNYHQLIFSQVQIEMKEVGNLLF